ncbi:MAG: tRNA (adenosine(37)-N6)-threonylcarbamoyltransferase complex dimerization subunit type 1 TsaB [Clostridia bacterium]|nr:tRNA (adenosine(37)-N6)-threonylcarbamoyltransferase complex dimerization subunit type 1 TsaB [Clostridia bacterium]
MLILAVDTTALTASAAAALYEDGKIKKFSLATVNNGLTHSELLFPLIDNALSTFGKSVKDVELFAVTAGPGSFTGVRIGVSAVKGLAFDGRPVASVSTLEALAENISAEGVICPLMDARRGVFYNAMFRREGGVLTRLTEDRAVSAEELSAEIARYGEVWLCGDGAELYSTLHSGEGKVWLSSLCGRYQNALSVAVCAARLWERGETVDAACLSPIYLRKPQAEREREERLKKENQI